MNFKLSHKFYVLIKSIIWISFAFFFLNVINNEKGTEVILGVLFCAVLIQMTLTSFINVEKYFYIDFSKSIAFILNNLYVNELQAQIENLQSRF